MLLLKIMTKNEQERVELGIKIHNALAGSKSYIESEVLLNYTDPQIPENEVWLVVGDDNDNDFEMKISQIEGK